MKILIIDLGTYNIKALLAEKIGKKISVIKTEQTKHNISFSWENFKKLEKITALEKLLLDKSFTADYTIINISSLFVDSRFLVLPFRDNKRVSQILPLELEDYVPFDMDAYIAEWHLVGGANKLYKIFSVLLEKEILEHYINIINHSGLDPEVIMSNFDPLINLIGYGDLYKFAIDKMKETKTNDSEVDKKDNANTEKKEELNNIEPVTTKKENILLLNIGHATTDIAVFKGNVILEMASISYAGKYITKTISNDYKISLEEVEKKKNIAEVIDNNQKIEQSKVDLSEVVISALDILVRETNQILSSFKVQYKEFIDNAIILGNGSKLSGLKEYLSKELNTKLIDIDLKNLFKEKNLILSKETLDNDILNSASLLQFFEHRTWRGLNFRKGAFAKEYRGDGIKQSLNLFRPILKSLVLIAVLFFVYHFTYKAILQNSIEKQASMIKKIAGQTFPEKGARTLEILLSDMDRLLLETDKKYKYYNKSNKIDNNSVLEKLDIISALAAKSGKIEIKEFEITSKSLKITNAMADTAETVQKFAGFLDKLPIFTEVNIGAVRLAADGLNKSFTLVAKLKEGKRK